MNIDRISFRIVSVVLLLVVAGVFSPSVAHAQGDKALAESLFEAGRALMKQKQYAAAAAKLEASQKQDPSPGTLINLGECYTALGKTATAWADYKAAAALAINMGRGQQKDLANQRAAALEPKLSKVTLQKPAEMPAGLTIKLDDRSLGVASLGVSMAVDPGEHTVELDAPGYKSTTKKFQVGAEADKVTVELPALEKAPEQPAAAPAAPAPAPAAPASPASKTAAPPAADQGTSGGSTKTIGFVLGGVGIASVGVGAVFGLMASSQASHAKSDNTLCPNKVCTPAGRSEINSAKTKALISTIGFGVGAAALVAGTVLVLTAGPSKERAPGSSTARLAPAVGPHGGGLVMAGSF